MSWGTHSPSQVCTLTEDLSSCGEIVLHVATLGILVTSPPLCFFGSGGW